MSYVSNYLSCYLLWDPLSFKIMLGYLGAGNSRKGEKERGNIAMDSRYGLLA